MMTLGGIAAAVGLVLDDAIVVVEHLAHRRAAGVGASAAMGEIAPMLVGSSLCTLAIFIPFIALSGLTGAFFRVLALSIAFMLTGSLAGLSRVPVALGRQRRSAPAPRTGSACGARPVRSGAHTSDGSHSWRDVLSWRGRGRLCSSPRCGRWP